MIIYSRSDIQQDTIQVKNTVYQDSVVLATDSTLTIKSQHLADSAPRKPVYSRKPAVFVFSDTTAVCGRNGIADITFYDSNNIVYSIRSDSLKQFPFIFTEKTRQIQSEKRATIIKHLKPGQVIPFQPLHDDWIIVIILIAGFLYSLVRKTSKSALPGITRFFLFRGINDPASRDIGGLFHWQSTILNLISFFIAGLYGYTCASYYDLIPSALIGINFWLICLGIIISAVTLRHIVCIVTGSISGERELFQEYLVGVYQFYRFSAIFFFILIILMSYTTFFPSSEYFLSGIIVLGIIYLFRIIRLLIIFINRNISIFYLILYLCALEILPVLITVKYFTGLV
jgi:hypothetical protein